MSIFVLNMLRAVRCLLFCLAVVRVQPDQCPPPPAQIEHNHTHPPSVVGDSQVLGRYPGYHVEGLRLRNVCLKDSTVLFRNHPPAYTAGAAAGRRAKGYNSDGRLFGMAKMKDPAPLNCTRARKCFWFPGVSVYLSGNSYPHNPGHALMDLFWGTYATYKSIHATG